VAISGLTLRTRLIVRVRRIVGQLLDAVLDQVASPFLDFTGQVQPFGVAAEILDGFFLINGRLVDTELFEERSDFDVVFEPIAVEEVEDDGRVEGGTLVRIDEGVIWGEEPEKVIRSPVDCFRSCFEIALLDLLQRKLDITSIPDAAGVPGYSETTSSWMAMTSSTDGYHNESAIWAHVDAGRVYVLASVGYMNEVGVAHSETLDFGRLRPQC